MKTIRLYVQTSVFIILFTLMICGCGGGDSGSSKQIVRITGDLSTGSHAKVKWWDKCIKWAVPSANALDDTLVTKVIVFYCNGNWSTADVEDGSFSINVEVDEPAGLIFVGSTNNFLGYLTLGSGLDSLPMTSLADSTTEIDLQMLSSTGNIVDASYDPLGTELELSAEELTAVAQCDDAFTCTIKNPDIDSNGVIDLLEGKYFSIYIQYFVNGGSFGGSLTPTVTTPADISGYRLSFKAQDPARPASVTFTGPIGSGLTDTPEEVTVPHTDLTIYQSPIMTIPAIPLAGEYTISYNLDSLVFDLADQSLITANIIVAVPTVTLNGDSTMNKVNWEYKLGDGSGEVLDPASVINGVTLQITGPGGIDRVYDSFRLPAETVEHTLSDQTILWSDITKVCLGVWDIYENSYVIDFVK